MAGGKGGTVRSIGYKSDFLSKHPELKRAGDPVRVDVPHPGAEFHHMNLSKPGATPQASFHVPTTALGSKGIQVALDVAKVAGKIAAPLAIITNVVRLGETAASEGRFGPETSKEAAAIGGELAGAVAGEALGVGIGSVIAGTALGAGIGAIASVGFGIALGTVGAIYVGEVLRDVVAEQILKNDDGD